jgi:hypothetical protein
MRGIATRSGIVPPYAEVVACVDVELDGRADGALDDVQPARRRSVTIDVMMRRHTSTSLPDAAAGNAAVAAVVADAAPRWIGPFYLAAAVLLIPWIVYLGIVLPDRTTSAHWDVAWVGFDVMEFVALALTGWFAYRRSPWVEVAATAAAAFLVVDAWFDITTANGGWNLVQATVLGVGIELPLAGLSVWIARRVEQRRRRAPGGAGAAS